MNGSGDNKEVSLTTRLWLRNLSFPRNLELPNIDEGGVLPLISAFLVPAGGELLDHKQWQALGQRSRALHLNVRLPHWSSTYSI